MLRSKPDCRFCLLCRLESSWWKLKFELDRHFDLDVCAVAIMFRQQNVESDWADELNKTQQVTDPTYAPELQSLLNLVSEHVCKLVREQFELSRANQYTYHYPIADFAFIRYNQPRT